MKSRRRDYLLAALGGIALLAACWHGSGSQRGALFVGVLASWVQAIGSIAAIVAAIVIGRGSDRRARQLAQASDQRARDLLQAENDRKARIAASTLALIFGLLETEAASKSTGLKKLRLSLDMKASTVTLADRNYFEALFLFERNDIFSEFREWALLLESDLGILASTVMQSVEQFNVRTKDSLGFFFATGSSPSSLKSLCSETIDRLQFVQEQAAEVERELEVAYGFSERANS